MIEDKIIEIDFEKGINLSRDEIRKFISQLEDQMKEMDQAEIPEKHYFSKGVYGREITLPKGSLIVGKIHKFQAMNVLSQGEVSILSIDGVIRVKAPFTFVSSPGAKRVIYAHSESVWTNFHGTDETNIETIEKEFIAENYDQVSAIEYKEIKRIEVS